MSKVQPTVAHYHTTEQGKSQIRIKQLTDANTKITQILELSKKFNQLP